MPINSDSTPPPRIGKIGPYTVFITPPSTPTPHVHPKPTASPTQSPAQMPPAKIQTPPPAPPVTLPPKQYDNYPPRSSFGFFWDAVAKVQNAHTSLDENVAYWFGLNQSKYQWALDDYYESKGIDPAEAKTKALSSKVDNV